MPEKTWRDAYPYIGIQRKRHFDELEFDVSDVYPPSIHEKKIALTDVYFVTEDAKQKLSDMCRRGHHLNARKLSYSDVLKIIDQVQDLIFQSQSPE